MISPAGWDWAAGRPGLPVSRRFTSPRAEWSKREVARSGIGLRMQPVPLLHFGGAYVRRLSDNDEFPDRQPRRSFLAVRDTGRPSEPNRRSAASP